MSSSTNYLDLFNRLLIGKLSPDETEQLVSLLANDQPDSQVAELLMQHLQQARETKQISAEVTAALEARLPAILLKNKTMAVPRIPLFKRAWMRYSAAAALIMLLAGGAWLWTHQTSAPPSLAPTLPVVKNNKIVPGSQGAILTLDDGRTVVLDSLTNGIIATQNGSKVLLHNGRLAYDTEGVVTGDVKYNTMTTPKGRQFQLMLTDGTRVWLNAASSIRYPTAFTGRERNVEVTGEAYFEVAKTPSLPFRKKVKKKPMEIEVLGTHFNINAYSNEASINTTLLEGSVKVSNGNEHLILKPGQQSQAGGTASKPAMRIFSYVNIQKVMAWKQGVFDFDNATLEEVMRQLERWYDIEVVYEKDIPPLEFIGRMGRDLSLAEVLHGLEVSEVHFSVSGRKVMVMP